MISVVITDGQLRQAAQNGFDGFLDAVIDAIDAAIGHQLNAETMAELTAPQVTLLAYRMLRDEVMDGGFVQLIHNGYGPFFYQNPFARMVKDWGIDDLAKVMRKTHSLYKKHRTEIERPCTDEEFMALFERFDEFDEYDDFFVEHEEEITGKLACYVDEHLDDFVKIIDDNNA